MLAQEPPETAVLPLQTIDDDLVTVNIWQIFTGLFATFAAGGVIGIAGAGLVATRLRDDAATMTAIEGATKNVPPEIAKLLIDLAKSGQAVGDLLIEALDGVPSTSKPTRTIVPPPISYPVPGSE